MADYKVLPYRDINGYIIARKRPYYPGSFSNGRHLIGGSYHTLASLVWCPERRGLMWIGKCENCERFAGHRRYEGVKCRTDKPALSGIYYIDRYK